MRRSLLALTGLLVLTAPALAQTAPVPATPAAAASARAVPAPGRTALSAKEQLNRAVMLRFYDRVFNRKDLSVVPELVTEGYIQHNPTVASGRAAFVAAFTGFFKAALNSSVEIKRVLVDGDYVILHSLFKATPQDRGSAVVDIFRLENGKVAEHWDVSQPVPEKPANSNTMF